MEEKGKQAEAENPQNWRNGRRDQIRKWGSGSRDFGEMAKWKTRQNRLMEKAARDCGEMASWEKWHMGMRGNGNLGAWGNFRNGARDYWEMTNWENGKWRNGFGDCG